MQSKHFPPKILQTVHNSEKSVGRYVQKTPNTRQNLTSEWIQHKNKCFTLLLDHCHAFSLLLPKPSGLRKKVIRGPLYDPLLPTPGWTLPKHNIPGKGP